MSTQELVKQLNPEHYDNLTNANAIGKNKFGRSSCQNNKGTVFAIGSEDNVVVYTSNIFSTKYATSISNPGNSGSLFGYKIAMDSTGDTIIVGAPGDNRAYVFDAQNKARTSWTQRSSGWNSNSYLGTSDSGTIHYGSDVDVAYDDDSLFVVGRPGDHKIELWSWTNGSSATLLKTITHTDNFGFSCKLSGDGQVVIAGGPGNYYPLDTTTEYGNGIAHVYAKDPSNASTWTQRTLPFSYLKCPAHVEYTQNTNTTIKRVTNTSLESGGTKTPLYPAFGYSVAINKDGTFIAVSAPNRRCFFAAEWINNTSYNWLTDKAITGEKDAFGSYLFMQHDGTRIVTGNTHIEKGYFWDQQTSQWATTNHETTSYCILDWNGLYFTNYSESFNQYSVGGLPTSVSKSGEFVLFSTKLSKGDYQLGANETRTTGINNSSYFGSTIFSFTRFAPTIKILGTTTVGGDLKTRFLSVGGDKTYIDNDSTIPGYINFENNRDEHSIFKTQIINTSQYTGDDNLSELMLFKSGHVRGLNSKGPDRIRVKSPSVILEGLTFENHDTVQYVDETGRKAEGYSRLLKEASAVYSRLTLTGIGNIGIGVPEYADHIIKENFNLGEGWSTPESSYYNKQNANANAQAPPLINHRLVIDGTQSIQNGKLYINNPISSNVITDGLSSCFNTMTKDCIQDTNTTNVPYVICDIKKRNPLLNENDGHLTNGPWGDRMRLYNTVTYDDVNKGLYFGTNSYSRASIHVNRDTITGTVTNSLDGVYTVSYWFMLKDYPQSDFGTNGKLVFTAYGYNAFGYGHKITSSGFKIQYSLGTSSPLNATVQSDYTVNYTFNQNVWYHVCVKVDNTAGNGATQGSATTQLWINGVSQSLTANETNRDMNGRFPGEFSLGVVNLVLSHTLGGNGMYGHLIGNHKVYIAQNGTDIFERTSVPDYNSATDLYNEGPPNEGMSLLGGMNISGGLRANGSSGTSGQVLTSSGGGAMSWSSVNVSDITDYITHTGDTNTKFGFPANDTFSVTTNNAERFRIDDYGNIGINNSSPVYALDVFGDINLTGKLHTSTSAGTTGQVLTSAGNSSAVSWANVPLPDLYNSGGILTDNNSLRIDLAASDTNGNLGISKGGTGATSFTHYNGLIYYDNSNLDLKSIQASGASNRVLLTGSPGSVPTWGLVTLGTHTQGNYVSGINAGGGITATSGTTPQLDVALDTNGGIGTNGSGELRIDFTNTSSIIGQLPASLVAGGSSQWVYNSAVSPPELTFDSANTGKIVGIGTPPHSSYKLTVSGSVLIDQSGGGGGGDLSVYGALSKGSGSFKIDHPLPSMSNTHTLCHSFIEGPKADLIYRGKVDLVNGSASINLDTVSNMTSGTFEVLNRDVQCFTSNESDWDAVKGSVSGNTLTISCQNASSTANVSWLVIGERKDKHMYDTGWTDDDGHVVPEKAKST